MNLRSILFLGSFLVARLAIACPNLSGIYEGKMFKEKAQLKIQQLGCEKIDIKIKYEEAELILVTGVIDGKLIQNIEIPNSQMRFYWLDNSLRVEEVDDKRTHVHIVSFRPAEGGVIFSDVVNSTEEILTKTSTN